MKKLLSRTALFAAFSAVAFSAYATETRPAYYVSEFQATNSETMKPYSAQVESTFKPYGGRFIVRGGEADIKEGFGAQGKLVIIKFDSKQQAEAWFNSPEYQKLIPIRQSSGNTRNYIVEGLPE